MDYCTASRLPAVGGTGVANNDWEFRFPPRRSGTPTSLPQYLGRLADQQCRDRRRQAGEAIRTKEDALGPAANSVPEIAAGMR
jgi:hypothetical protein